MRHLKHRMITTAGMEGPPGKPEAWTCRHCGARVLNRDPVCTQCKKAR